MAGTQPPSSSTSRGREDYLESSDYFMAVACLAAQRSKDPSTQEQQCSSTKETGKGEDGTELEVGACIVNQEGKIVGIGHNRMPNGCDGELPWTKDGEWLNKKSTYVCHAELNAMMNKNSADVKGCTMYVTLFPCNECTKLIIQAGIREVVYLSDKYHDTPEVEASKKMLCYAGIPYRQFQFMRTEIVIDFNSFNPTQGAVSKRKRLT